MNTNPTSFSGLRRDGHLSDLGIDLVLDGEPPTGLDAHLQTCAACQARLDAAAAHDAALPVLPDFLPASNAPSYSEPKPANRPWMWASTLLVAAVALFAATAALQANDDGIRVKGSSITLQVFKDEGDSSARLRDGDQVQPGDRLGFRLRQRRAGHVMIIGVDQLDDPYLCFPQSEEGDSIELKASSEPRALPEAIRMDDTRGNELLVAIVCDAPFTYETMAQAVVDDQIPSDCVTDSLTLEKP